MAPSLNSLVVQAMTKVLTCSHCSQLGGSGLAAGRGFIWRLESGMLGDDHPLGFWVTQGCGESSTGQKQVGWEVRCLG